MGNLGYFYIVCGIVVVDRVSKALISLFYHRGTMIFFRTGFFSLRYVENTGGAFGIFPRRSHLFLLVTVASIGLIIYLLFFSNISQFVVKLGLALLLGGSCGNMIDRMVYGAVIDFIQFGNTPIFNLADVAIVGGTGLIVFGLIGGSKFVGS